MHDLDRSYMELEADEFGYEAESEEEALSESEVEELASELLTLNSEEELDQFLGGLLKRAAGPLGKVFKSGLGRSVGGLLKGVVKKALPGVGSALGNMVLPGVGGALGGNLASQAGSMFGLELEGMSGEDQEFEVAKQVVRLAGDAAKNALLAPASAGVGAARQAVEQAAQRFAPGMLGGQAVVGARAGQSGRWVRRGNKIVIYGV